MSILQRYRTKLTELKDRYRGRKFSGQRKVFCVGRNKTGTTSIARLFAELGLAVGAQRKAERLLDDWIAGDYRRITHYVRYGGIAFQDIPFSLPGTYAHLDRLFPGSKFILTVRDSPEAWYDSLVRFQTKLWGKDGQVPSAADLRAATYVAPGYVWKVFRALHDTPENDLYHRETFLASYRAHNAAVLAHFADRPEQLLIVDVGEADAARKICAFLGSEQIIDHMPWENKT